MGVFAIRIGTGLAIVTVIAAPVFFPALQPRALHVRDSVECYAYWLAICAHIFIPVSRLWAWELADNLASKQDGSLLKVTN